MVWNDLKINKINKIDEKRIYIVNSLFEMFEVNINTAFLVLNMLFDKLNRIVRKKRRSRN
jgi:hypothetical protein